MGYSKDWVEEHLKMMNVVMNAKVGRWNLNNKSYGEGFPNFSLC